jgi:hypothetical protein
MVKNYDNLLNTNLMFFRGEIDQTFYYGAPWGKGDDQNNHAIVSTNNLIKLTEKYRIFTVNGQSNYSDNYTKQRSYLFFYIEESMLEKIYNKLVKDERIWLICNRPVCNESSECLEIGSVDSSTNKIVLTLDNDDHYSVWDREHSYRYEDNFSYETVSKILKSLFYCSIICKNFSEELNADQILLDLLENIN